MLPIEIIDKIFLHCDFKTLKATQSIQSPFVLNTTKYNKIKDCFNNQNYNNGHWLLYYKHHDYDKQFIKALRLNKFAMVDFLYAIKYVPPQYIITKANIIYDIPQYLCEKKYNVKIV